MPDYSPLTVANSFLSLAGKDGLTPLQLQKLVYLSHGWSLAARKQEMIRGQVEAWKYGPVVPPLYYETRIFGSSPVEDLIDVKRNPLLSEDNDPTTIPPFDTPALDVVHFVWRAYGHLSGPHLSDLTHKPGTPWYQVWHEQDGKSKLGAVIPNDLIQEHYEELLDKVNAPVPQPVGAGV